MKKKCCAGILAATMLTSMVPHAWAASSGFSVDSLTLQPGETAQSINLNWYAPEGTVDAKVKFGSVVVDATEQPLTTPTKVVDTKYTDTGKIVCKTTVSGLDAGTSYEYQISNNGGATWSQVYTYKTPDSDSFKFAYLSDPQVKESQENNGNLPEGADGGWDPEPANNFIGWQKTMEVIGSTGVSLVVSAGDQIEDQSWGKTSEYQAFFAPEEMASIAYAPAVGNHDRHYMFADHFNLPNEMEIAEDGQPGTETKLEQVATTFRGQNSGTSQSHGNYIQATAEEIAANSESNGVFPNADGKYDFTERREMETRANYYYLYNNVLFVTLNSGAYPGGNDPENAENPDVPSANKDNSEAEAMVQNFDRTINAATKEYAGQYDWLIVTHHTSTQSVAKHTTDSDVQNLVDAGFETLMDKYDVDFVLAGHDHVYARSYVLKNGEPTTTESTNYTNPDGTIYLTANCSSDMQYCTPFQAVDKSNNEDYPLLANGEYGSQAYMEGNLPHTALKWNQEYSPNYSIFEVDGNTIHFSAYNLAGDSQTPSSEMIDQFTVVKSDTEQTAPETTEPTTEPATPSSTLPFSDVVSSEWYAEAVDFVYNNDLMAGTSQTTFSPDENTSRAMLTAILWRQADCPVVDAEMNFTDVASDAYYGQALRWAVKQGIVTPAENNTFGPDDAITREELATMLYGFAKVSGYDMSKQADLSQYTDASEVSQSNVEAVKWVVAQGLITGMSDTSLSLQSNVTRAQIATTMMRLCQL